MRSFVILLALIAAGCHYDPYTSVFTTTLPKTNDVVGVYVADSMSVKFISKDGHYSTVTPCMTLQDDGAIVISNIPDWWLTEFGEPHGGFDSGRGTWSIRKHQDWWGLLVRFKDTTQFASRTNRPGGIITDMMLVGQKPPYKIHLTIGDPDQGQCMEFERKAEKQ